MRSVSPRSWNNASARSCGPRRSSAAKMRSTASSQSWWTPYQPSSSRWISGTGRRGRTRSTGPPPATAATSAGRAPTEGAEGEQGGAVVRRQGADDALEQEVRLGPGGSRQPQAHQRRPARQRGEFRQAARLVPQQADEGLRFGVGEGELGDADVDDLTGGAAGGSTAPVDGRRLARTRWTCGGRALTSSARSSAPEVPSGTSWRSSNTTHTSTGAS